MVSSISVIFPMRTCCGLALSTIRPIKLCRLATNLSRLGTTALEELWPWFAYEGSGISEAGSFRESFIALTNSTFDVFTATSLSTSSVKDFSDSLSTLIFIGEPKSIIVWTRKNTIHGSLSNPDLWKRFHCHCAELFKWKHSCTSELCKCFNFRIKTGSTNLHKIERMVTSSEFKLQGISYAQLNLTNFEQYRHTSVTLINNMCSS